MRIYTQYGSPWPSWHRWMGKAFEKGGKLTKDWQRIDNLSILQWFYSLYNPQKDRELGSTILAGCYFLSFYLILVARFLVLKAGQEPKAESLEVNHQHILPGSWAKTGNLVENPLPRALSSIRSIF